jgi:glycosyltransferase involved in cell wall biosynthesis
MQSEFNPCIIIPCFKHSKLLLENMDSILEHNIPTIVVDDGSPDGDLLSEGLKSKNITLLKLAENIGKGGAIIHGLKKALELNFTHAIQVDADSQHNYNDIPKFILEASAYPEDLILGTPIFDDTAPKERIYGRKISTLLIAFETLSNQAHDVLFGFRVYPLKQTLNALNKFSINFRMGFDAQIIVYLLWSGINIKNIKSQVKYDPSINSNFRYFEDNLSFIAMHIRLLLLSIIYAPLGLIRRNIINIS